MRLIVDSGAFTCFTAGKSIDLNEYCKFLTDNKKYIDVSVNLDVIGPNDPDVAAAAGRENYLKMRERGIDALPVYHARESRKWLDLMIDDTDYVGLSGTSLVSPTEDRAWHRLVWSYITTKQGYPIVKTHSFGNTSPYMALTFPWTTMDSASWMIQGGRAARVKLQNKSFQLRSNKIGDVNYISDEDTGLKRESWEYEIQELGLDPKAVMSVEAKGSQLAMMRSFLVAADLLRLQEQTGHVKKFLKPNSLITTKRQEEGGIIRGGTARMVFVISPSAYNFNFPVLTALGIKDILVSYYYVVTAPKGFWEKMLLPYLADPVGFCETDPKTKKFWDKLNEFLLKKHV